MAQSNSRSVSFPARVVRAARALHPDQRVAAAGALGLLLLGGHDFRQQE